MLECLIPAARRRAPASPRRFQPALVSYRTRDGPAVTQRVPLARVPAALPGDERRARAPASSLRYDASLPAPSYRIAPGHVAGAVWPGSPRLLALAAVGLAWIALRPDAAATAGPSGSRLEQALRAVRASTRQRPTGRSGGRLSAGSAASSRAVERPDEATRRGGSPGRQSAPTARSAGDFADRRRERGRSANEAQTVDPALVGGVARPRGARWTLVARIGLAAALVAGLVAAFLLTHHAPQDATRSSRRAEAR